MQTDADPLTVVLAGGLGTRIRHLLGGLPKPLAPAAGRPFVEWVLRFLRAQGISRVVLSVGYLGDRIEEVSKALCVPGLAIRCVREPAPLGTAGALTYALTQLPEEIGDLLVCNGDSLALAQLDGLRSAFKDPAVDAAILGVWVADAGRYGTLVCGADGALTGFAEKRPGVGLVNAGVYLLRRSVISRFPDHVPLSLECDVFPLLLRQGVRVLVVPCDCPFLDIGTESTLTQADPFVLANMRWFE